MPVPVTEYCEILDASGNPLEGITIHPMMPAGLMPLVLPPEGITARLLATDDMRLSQLDGLDPENTIVALLRTWSIGTEHADTDVAECSNSAEACGRSSSHTCRNLSSERIR